MPLFPISFSIPEDKIVSSPPDKTKTLATLIPGDASTYVFTTEESYYADYRSSILAKTCKKGGWDCMRHYEILANGCVPLFEDLAKCPTTTMVHFPKQLVKRAMTSSNPKIHIPDLLDYTRRRLTCRAMAQYVLDTAGFPRPSRVLFLSGHGWSDYLRDTVLIGMKQILGSNCVDDTEISFLYDDWAGDQSTLWGRGFSYVRTLPATTKPRFSVADIASRSFDLIVYGSVHRGMPHWEEVHKHYTSKEIVVLCGEDDCSGPHTLAPCPLFDMARYEYNCFLREWN